MFELVEQFFEINNPTFLKCGVHLRFEQISYFFIPSLWNLELKYPNIGIVELKKTP